MARVTTEDCVTSIPNRFHSWLFMLAEGREICHLETKLMLKSITIKTQL